MNIRDWYIRNQDAISWFIIGWLSMGLLDNLVRGQYIWAGLDVLFIWLNYKLIPMRMQ